VPALLNSANRARIEDFGRGDLVQVDCAACHHVALLTPDFLLRLGLSPQAKVLDLKRGSGAAGAERGDELSFRSGGAGD
jgi:hypothetical protein